MKGIRALLRVWLAVSAAALASILVWAFAPIMLLVLLVTAALGAASIAMIAVARALQAWSARRSRSKSP